MYICSANCGCEGLPIRNRHNLPKSIRNPPRQMPKCLNVSCLSDLSKRLYWPAYSTVLYRSRHFVAGFDCCAHNTRRNTFILSALQPGGRMLPEVFKLCSFLRTFFSSFAYFYHDIIQASHQHQPRLLIHDQLPPVTKILTMPVNERALVGWQATVLVAVDNWIHIQ